MKRRDFINWVGLGWLATSLPVAIAACSSTSTTSSSASTPREWQKVGTVAELDKTGEILVKDSPVGAVLVVGKSSKKDLIAVDPTCPHQGCTVEWKANKDKFVCPCHDSEFGVHGQVEKGPAEEPLKTYMAKIEGNSVVVKPA
jgi:cytochrome b6-f complex iron-sulfur subunit